MERKTSLPQRIALILFGLFLATITLEIGLRLGGFIIISLQEQKNLQAMKHSGTCRIMCLGGSTTQGQYPHYLEKVLNQGNPRIKFSVIDKGIIGINTKTIVSQLEANLDKYRPDIVVTMMGINDWGEHIPRETVPASKAALLLRSLKVYKLFRLACLHIGTNLREIRSKTQFIKDAQLLQKAGGINYKNGYMYIGPHRPYYLMPGEIAEAVASLNKAIKLNPNDDAAYAELGWFYFDLRRFDEAEEALKKAVELNPKNDWAYTGWARLYLSQARFNEAYDSLKKAIKLGPKNDCAYAELGELYFRQGIPDKGEEALKKAVELNPKNDWAYAKLGDFYFEQNRFDNAAQAFKNALGVNVENDSLLYGKLSIIYSQMGNIELAAEYANKANSLRERYYSPITIDSYYKLKQILDKRGVRLVCVQYPMRSVAPLKKILGDNQGVIFVDNEKIFKDTVAKDGYRAYFRDMFGGEFGHCTPKGNSLLASNIAEAILENLTRKGL